MLKIVVGVLVGLMLPSMATARPREVRVPLRDGKISTAELARHLESDLHLPDISRRLGFDLTLRVSGLGGWLAVHGINDALGEGFHVSISPDALVIDVDVDKLPANWGQTAVAIRRFTQDVAPEAAARQQRHFGLLLPKAVDPSKPLVILIHGLDGDRHSCADLAALLEQDGRQIATFAYPAEQPIADSADLLARDLIALHETYPRLQIDMVTQSMGGLVARQYIEGAEYAGGVQRLIMIAPPNGGSNWTGYAWISKIDQTIGSWRHEADWSPVWFITEGLDEAATDLKPNSKFLHHLNALPRRQGVNYTIIAGDQPACYRKEAELFETSANIFCGTVKNWWGFRQVHAALEHKANSFRTKLGTDDGPVSVAQAKLAGVKDFVVLPADHTALYCAYRGNVPAAWPVIHDRLNQ